MTKRELIKLFKKAQNKSYSNQSEIDELVIKIAEIETRFYNYFDGSGFSDQCQKCLSPCCAKFILNHLKSRPEVCYYVATQNPDFEDLINNNQPLDEFKCVLLGKQGCVLKKSGRPALCINYVCQFPWRSESIPYTQEISKGFMELRELLTDK